jgi:tyrosine-protein kinase Etk/Wzc
MQENGTNHNGQTFDRSELWSLSLRDLFYKYIRFLPLFILSVAIALFGAYVYLRYATPIYSTTGTLLIKSDQPNNRQDKFSDLFGNKGQNIQSEIEILKSKGLMARVVEKKNLQLNYFVKGKIKTINIYKGAPFILDVLELADSSQPFTLKIRFADKEHFRINKDNTLIGFGQGFKNQFGMFRLVRNYGGISREYSVKYQPTYQAAATYVGALQVTPKSIGTGIINITMQSTNPNFGADVVNKLMEEYGGYTKELKNKGMDQTIAFIQERIEDIGHVLDSLQDKLLRYTQENNLIDLERQSTQYFERIGAADKAINEQQMQLTMLELIEAYLKDKKNVYIEVVLSSFGIADATLNALVSTYNGLQGRRQALIDANVPVKNPLVLEIDEQIEKSRTSILENLANIKKSFYKTIGELRKGSDKSLAQLESMPFTTKEYFKLKKQVDNIQSIYNLLQEKKEETRITRSANIENTQIVESAYVSNTPVKPKRRSIQIMAILIGLAIPALFIFGSELLNDKVTTRFDVEKITQTPILGEVGHSYADKALIVNKTTRSMVAEQFRIIRTNLQYITGKAEKTTILVTSSFSGEGKSFVSINMGAVMALAGKRTLLLEFDIRKPKILSNLGISKGPGITNFLIGTASLDELIKPVAEVDKLFVLGCGPIPPNPSELLLEEKVTEMFTVLRSQFDVIIIDTAPVGMVSDAQTLSKFADCTLYLVRQGHTFKKQITLIDEFYRENKLPSVSIVINDVKIRPGYGYYGYGRYGYGYGYGYGSYYEEEHPPKSLLEKVADKVDPRKWFGK